MIYFMRAGNDGPIKIGHSGNPESRRKNLQTAHYHELEIIGVMPDDADVEGRLKKQFAAHRIRGEWFEPVPEIIDFIRTHCSPGKINTVLLLENRECRIVFSEPVQASVGLLLHVGAYRGIRLLGDRKPERFYGIEGPIEVLESFLLESGVCDQALEEFRAAVTESEQ